MNIDCKKYFLFIKKLNINIKKYITIKDMADINFKKYIPYILLYLPIFWLADVLAELYRTSNRQIIMVITNFNHIIQNPSFSLYYTDLMFGIFTTLILHMLLMFKIKHAKKFRNGVEYGSARWGTAKDIKPFIDPTFQNNKLLTQTERVMIGQNKMPKYNINKNVLIIGGSGSGKTRFHIKPNLMQMNSSYVVTDPKGTILEECGKMLQKNGYKIKILNNILFSESMHYNPFEYIKSEKDILKLVSCIMENTKGENTKGGEDFWEKAEALLYQALIAYIWYEAPEEEKNIITLLEMSLII